MLIEAKKPFLVWTDLVDIDMVIPGVEKLPHTCNMALGIGATDNGFGDIFFTYHFSRLLEVGRRAQLLV
jgi:hypothetical protein